jgi:hypothetical protein
VGEPVKTGQKRGEIDSKLNTDTVALLAPSEEKIRHRAYEIYLERAVPGGELDDWLRAERELKKIVSYNRSRRRGWKRPRRGLGRGVTSAQQGSCCNAIVSQQNLKPPRSADKSWSHSGTRIQGLRL